MKRIHLEPDDFLLASEERCCQCRAVDERRYMTVWDVDAFPGTKWLCQRCLDQEIGDSTAGYPL